MDITVTTARLRRRTILPQPARSGGEGRAADSLPAESHGSSSRVTIDPRRRRHRADAARACLPQPP